MTFMKLCMFALAFAAILSGQAPKLAVPPTTAKAPAIANPNEVILTIGDRKITFAQYQLLVSALLPEKSQELAYGPGRRQFAQKLVEVLLLADEALRTQLDKKPDLALQLNFHDNSVLAQAMFKKIQQTLVVPDADIQTYYNTHKSEYEVVNARRILIRVKGSVVAGLPGKPELTDAEARAKAVSIREQLVGGGDFAKLAQQESDDAASRLKGGDIGPLKRGTTNQQFEQAAYALKAGEISAPVKSAYGYDIIQVQSRSFASLEDVRDDAIAHLRSMMAPKAVDDLVSQSKFDLNDAYFGPDPAAHAK
jgi:peptidyl-prolyl cis-trans isomerase C